MLHVKNMQETMTSPASFKCRMNRSTVVKNQECPMSTQSDSRYYTGSYLQGINLKRAPAYTQLSIYSTILSFPRFEPRFQQLWYRITWLHAGRALSSDWFINNFIIVVYEKNLVVQSEFLSKKCFHRQLL